eukprot:jgi/Botrbrau1/12343/Bobra.4_3s0015.1
MHVAIAIAKVLPVMGLAGRVGFPSPHTANTYMQVPFCMTTYSSTPGWTNHSKNLTLWDFQELCGLQELKHFGATTIMNGLHAMGDKQMAQVLAYS